MLRDGVDRIVLRSILGHMSEAMAERYAGVDSRDKMSKARGRSRSAAPLPSIGRSPVARNAVAPITPFSLATSASVLAIFASSPAPSPCRPSRA
jgi:hypothetical protein